LFLKKAHTDEQQWDIFFWFRDTRNLLNRNIQSISQLLLVHSPFLLVSALYPATVSSILFIARSVFQPVQILIKSVEAIDQRKLASIKDNAQIFVKSLFKKYIVISFVASSLCLLIAVYLFPIVYADQAVPQLNDLLFWAGILICLSCSRSVEMLLVKNNMYKRMNLSYLLSGLGVSSLLLLNLVFHLQVSLSFYIFIGWLFLAMTYYLIVIKGLFHE
jgi:magnesium-transporting ATPase (P-type)